MGVGVQNTDSTDGERLIQEIVSLCKKCHEPASRNNFDALSLMTPYLDLKVLCDSSPLNLNPLLQRGHSGIVPVRTLWEHK